MLAWRAPATVPCLFVATVTSPPRMFAPDACCGLAGDPQAVGLPFIGAFDDEMDVIFLRRFLALFFDGQLVGVQPARELSAVAIAEIPFQLRLGHHAGVVNQIALSVEDLEAHFLNGFCATNCTCRGWIRMLTSGATGVCASAVIIVKATSARPRQYRFKFLITISPMC